MQLLFKLKSLCETVTNNLLGHKWPSDYTIGGYGNRFGYTMATPWRCHRAHYICSDPRHFVLTVHKQYPIAGYAPRSIDTGLPMLLMELMDDSLTHFLESSLQPHTHTHTHTHTEGVSRRLTGSVKV